MAPVVDGALSALVGWLLTYAIHSTLLLGGACLLARGRLVGERGADLLWKMALVGGLATATVQSVVDVGPSVDIPSAAAPVRMRRVELTEIRPGGGPPVVRRWSGPVRVGPRAPIGVLAALLTAAWALAAAVRLGMLARAHLRLRRCLAGRRALHAGELTRLAESLAGPRVRITVSELLPAPVALGRAEICLPRRVLDELTMGQQRSIVAHEAAHLVRRDPHWLLALGTVGAVFFFQPLNALGLRRYREGAEFLCDAWAVRATGRPRELARSIASIAAWLSAPAGEVPMAAMVEHGSPLVRRVHRLVGPERSGEDIRAWRAGAVAAILLLGAVLLSAPHASVRHPVLKRVAARQETFEELTRTGQLLRHVRTTGDGRLLDSLPRLR
ncbi:MAG TPA: M56 family metallopeptidase [Longimicrobium sp.]|jgi:beta-lactamase regulating signal transducer with metallopeptidase domain